MTYRALSAAALTVAALAMSLILTISGCGGSPEAPGGVGPPPPPVIINNPPPVIESIVASTSRAEVDTNVTLTATVRDAETPVGQLRFEWAADAGTFTGEGASVTWRAPREIAAPTDLTIRLTVTETLASGLLQSVNGTSPAIRVHDSPNELGTLAMGFLGDFANSSVSPSTCIRDFSDSCPGKAQEKGDIEWNREHVTVLNSSLRLRGTRVSANGLTGDMTVACGFTSRILKCDAGDAGCVVGSVGTVAGDCTMTAVYEQQRWWLCTSNFSGSIVPAGFRSFFPPRKE